MAVTVPPSLQPISESPERRAAPGSGAGLGRVRGHARRTSAPPPHDLKPDPATALALAHARLSAAHAETTLQRAAADGLRGANAQLRDENGALRARVRELERRLAQRAPSTSPEPLTPTGTSSGDSEGTPGPGPGPAHAPSPADTPRTHSTQRAFRRFSDPPGGRGLGTALAHDTQTPPAPGPGSPGGTGGLAFDDPAAALWGVYGDLRGADARMDALYTFVRASGGGGAPGAPGPAAAGVRDMHWALFCALQQLQATFARRPR